MPSSATVHQETDLKATPSIPCEGLRTAKTPANQDGFGYITDLLDMAIRESRPLNVKGRVIQVVGTIIKAVVPGAKIGELCSLRNPWEDWELLAEVVGFSYQAALLTPLGNIAGISSATEVIPSGKSHTVAVGPNMFGRVLGGLGTPIDNKGPIQCDKMLPVYGTSPDPLTRRLITRSLPLGVRSLDAVLTCGEGQRMGIFAAAGVGKSTLLGSIVKNCDADVIVLALIGERGREVRDFIENDLGEAGLNKSVLIIATSDRPAMERIKAAYVATTVAEYYRDKGQRVLLLMDSVTRFARALREIGLAAGEPPTRRGFPPSVFATLPQLMERAGMSDKGSITALYTVLVEGDDMTEPIADETRSILDGHIVLSRKLAEANHYPAIDVLASVSRVMDAVVSDEQRTAAARMRQLLSKYQDIELLLKLGEFKAGNDPLADEAIAKMERIQEFLKQDRREKADFFETQQRLCELVK